MGADCAGARNGLGAGAGKLATGKGTDATGIIDVDDRGVILPAAIFKIQSDAEISGAWVIAADADEEDEEVEERVSLEARMGREAVTDGDGAVNNDTGGGDVDTLSSADEDDDEDDDDEDDDEATAKEKEEDDDGGDGSGGGCGGGVDDDENDDGGDSRGAAGVSESGSAVDDDKGSRGWVRTRSKKVEWVREAAGVCVTGNVEDDGADVGGVVEADVEQAMSGGAAGVGATGDVDNDDASIGGGDEVCVDAAATVELALRHSSRLVYATCSARRRSCMIPGTHFSAFSLILWLYITITFQHKQRQSDNTCAVTHLCYTTCAH